MLFEINREDLVSGQLQQILDGEQIVLYLHMCISKLFRLSHDSALLSIIYAAKTVTDEPVETINLLILKL